MVVKIIEKLKYQYKAKKLNVLKELNTFNEKRLLEVKENLDTDFKKLIEEHKNLKPEIENKKKILKLSREIKNLRSYIKIFLDFSKSFFNNEKRLFNIVILLKTGNIDSFQIYENISIQGFKKEKEYYNIDKEAVINQNNESFVFYYEGIATPINFKKSKIDKTKFDVEFNSQSLIDVVDGKAFKGIINLGKDNKSFLETMDIKMLLIGVVIIILTILHFTGQIDIVQMFGIK